MNNYTLYKIDQTEEVIRADTYEWDKLSTARAVIFYKIKDQKREPIAYICDVSCIKEEKE